MLDWDQLQTFLAVARQGNLSAAARTLHVDQSTVGRRLATLHAQVGVQLLHRTPTGYSLTAAGERILATVERMDAEVTSIERSVAGEDARIAGEVRITTVEAFGANVVMPLLAPLLTSEAALQIEMITDYRVLSLSRREADVAIRLAEFEESEAVVTRVGEMVFGLYASRAYLAARGRPDFGKGAAGHELVTSQRDLAAMPESVELLGAASEAHVAVRANSRAVQLRAVQAGLGLGLVPCYLAGHLNDLEEVELPIGRVARGLWLGVHRDSRDVRRIRVVVDELTRGLRSWSAEWPAERATSA